ncbi:MAG TPA: response regulator [Rhodopila sp.]|nr:response regulator [Rhodopila sp.]
MGVELRAMAESCKGISVAIVDDDHAILDALKLLLELAGHSVATFDSAPAFLEARPAPLGCLIVDQNMPWMTGLELASRLRAEGYRIPILLVTGSPTPGIAARAAELCIEQVLEKPPPEDDLLHFIDEHQLNAGIACMNGAGSVAGGAA